MMGTIISWALGTALLIILASGFRMIRPTEKGIELINKQLKESPSYINWQKVDKWDGKLPKVTGGSVPLIDVGGVK